MTATVPRVAGPGAPRWARGVAAAAGAMMVAGSLLNTYLTVTAPQVWGALGAWFPAPALLRTAWDATMTAHPFVWPPLVGVGFELAVGVLALSPRRGPRLVGLAGIVLFHLGLLAMGLWAWALPVLALVVPATVAVARHTEPRGPQ